MAYIIKGKVGSLKSVFVSAFLLVCGDAAAQIAVRSDSMRTVELRQGEVYSPLRAEFERRALRRERNYVQLDTHLDISQTQFNNWNAGSDDAFMAKATIDFQHKYTYGRLSVETRLSARYGMNYIDHRMFKNEDYLRINNMIGWRFSKFWSYAATSEFTSQFTIGRVSRTDRTKTSNFMAPGYWKPAVGITYSRAPWTVDIAPIGGSATFVLDKALSRRGVYGVKAGKRAQWQIGSSLRVEYRKNMLKDVIEFKSEVYAFTNYKQKPIGRWETTCRIRAAKFLTTTIYSKMLYNNTTQVRHPDRLQYNYSIGVGVGYTFKNK